MNPTMDTTEQECYIWWRLDKVEQAADYLAKILGDLREITHISAQDSDLESDSDYAGYVSCGEGVYVRSRSVIAIE